MCVAAVSQLVPNAGCDTPDITTFLSLLFKAGCWGIVCMLTWLGRGNALACAWYRYASNTLAMKISGVGIVKVNCPLIFFHFVVAIVVNYISLILLSYQLGNCLDDPGFESL